MDVKRVEWISNFVSNSGGQQSERIQSLRLERLLGGAAAFCDIAQDHGVTDLLARPVWLIRIGLVHLATLNNQRHDVKVDESIGRIKNLHIAADRSAALGEGVPIETAHPFFELFPDRF